MTPHTGYNCLSHWFPILQAAIPANVPRTEIIQAPSDLHLVLDGQQPTDWEFFMSDLRVAADHFGYPCFLRTGHTSDKHSWKRTCHVTGPDDFGPHVCALVEFSECCGIVGLPYNVFAVREWLPGPALAVCPRYGGMPVREEYRFFVRDGKIECRHPYWPAEALVRGGAVAADMPAVIGQSRAGEVSELVLRAAAAFPGYWSMDALWTDRGWFITDMALGADSWHWPGCSAAPDAGA